MADPRVESRLKGLTEELVTDTKEYRSLQQGGVMPYSREYIAALMDRVDIVSVVRSFVQMRKTAGGDYVGLCPFHSERNPSFKVITQKQFYYCHACGAHGSAVTFLMESQGLIYPTAVNFLAKQCRFYPKEWSRRLRRSKLLEQRKRR